MGQMYCIYNDKLVDEENSNLEHIIPLSLGGCDEFSIKVDSKINSELGSAIDGKMSKDIFISFIRQNKNYQGHSKKEVATTLKKSKITTNHNQDIPVQIKFLKDTFEIYNPIESRILTKEEVKNLSISSEVRLDKFIRICFTAKVLLSAGYYVYGNTFVSYADHKSLRKLMNLNLSESKESIKNTPLKVYDEFNQIDKEDSSMMEVIKVLCSLSDCSCVIFHHSTTNIIGTVCIGGHFIGMINFNAEIENFPNNDDFRLGYIVCVQDGILKRDSFYNGIEKVYQILKKYLK